MHFLKMAVTAYRNIAKGVDEMSQEKLKTVGTQSIAKDVDEMVLAVRCFICQDTLSVTIEEIRRGSSVYCANCEVWLPLGDKDGIFKGLHDAALMADKGIEGSISPCREP